jgi:hypothetical protein
MSRHSKPVSRSVTLSAPIHWPFRAWADALLHRPIELLALATALLLVGGGSLLYLAERGAGGSIRSWWDALWLCATSATTDSYGDVAPSTAVSRFISIVIAFTGIILVGSFTASITNYIAAQADHGRDRLDALAERLDRIEALLRDREAK